MPYLRVFLTFARNSLIRDMMFPANFIIEAISSISWMMMNLGFYALIFQYTDHIGAGAAAGEAWDKYQFFVFIATTMFVNSLVQAFFMPNEANSRRGSLLVGRWGESAADHTQTPLRGN